MVQWSFFLIEPPEAKTMGAIAQNESPEAKTMGAITQNESPEARTMGAIVQNESPEAKTMRAITQNESSEAKTMGAIAQNEAPEAIWTKLPWKWVSRNHLSFLSNNKKISSDFSASKCGKFQY